MCLQIYDRTNEAFLQKTKKTKRKYVTRYKIVEKRDGRGLVSPVYDTFTYKPGYNKSSSTAKTCVSRKSGVIEKGIHVCNSLQDAKNHWLMQRTNSIIVKVRCMVEDFIACDNSDSVFKGVYLSEKEYRRALKTKDNRLNQVYENFLTN